MLISKKDKFILWLSDIGKEDIGFVGGKGANLGEMWNAKFPVPNAFIVTSKAYFYFLEKANLKNKIMERLKNLDYENNDMLQQRTQEIRDWILKAPVPKDLEKQIKKAYRKLCGKEDKFVAIRSSATAEDLPEASFAGQQETYLNIKGEGNVVLNVQKTWASLFTARATYYRHRQGFPHEKVGLASIVQQMIESEVAGVMFTSVPTGDRSKIIVESAYGLGEAVVSGAVTPDYFLIDKLTNKIIEKKIAEQHKKLVKLPSGENEWVVVPVEEIRKQKLTDSKVLDLAKIGKRIEEHYKFPQDIEWAFEGGKLYIVQSRAITTLGLSKKLGEVREKEISADAKVLLKGLAASPGLITGTVKIVGSYRDLGKIEKGDILVTTMTNPDMVPAMERASAIVTDEGGITSHAAIVSRELGVPAVVGTEKATKVLRDLQIVTVDGNSGKVYEGSLKDRVEKVVEAAKQVLTQKQATLTKIKVNLALPQAAERAAKTGADGIGLLRAEHLMAQTGIHPYHLLEYKSEREIIEMLKDSLRQIVKYFKDKPVWYRTFDARTDEFKELKGGDKEKKEENPMIGNHGIRRALKEDWLIKLELKAIKELRKEGYKKIGVMIPFTIHPEELVKVKDIMRSIGLEPHKDLELGIMLETPAAAMMIDEYIGIGIDFVSFGTNDLTQLVLGIDRGNEDIQDLFTELHPAVLRLIQKVIQKCNAAGVKTSICGQAGSNPEMAEHLVKFGIKSISANIDAVETIRRKVKEVEEKLYG